MRVKLTIVAITVLSMFASMLATAGIYPTLSTLVSSHSGQKLPL